MTEVILHIKWVALAVVIMSIPFGAFACRRLGAGDTCGIRNVFQLFGLAAIFLFAEQM